MKIAVLGWGSLIWSHKNLKIKDKNWKEDSPELPIEFARVSNDGRLTLVIYEGYLERKERWVKTLWTEMDVESIEEAILNLGKREGTSCRKIGFIYKKALNLRKEFKDRKKLCKNTPKEDIEVSEGDYYFEKLKPEHMLKYENEIIKEIEKWMSNKKLDGVVWTVLSSNFKGKTGMKFNEENIIKYLKELKPEQNKKAEEYIRNAPPQIRTVMRKVIEDKLGWVHDSNHR